MKRETKAGFIVTLAFLSLLGVVLASKYRQIDLDRMAGLIPSAVAGPETASSLAGALSKTPPEPEQPKEPRPRTSGVQQAVFETGPEPVDPNAQVPLAPAPNSEPMPQPVESPTPTTTQGEDKEPDVTKPERNEVPAPPAPPAPEPTVEEPPAPPAPTSPPPAPEPPPPAPEPTPPAPEPTPSAVEPPPPPAPEPTPVEPVPPPPPPAPEVKPELENPQPPPPPPPESAPPPPPAVPSPPPAAPAPVETPEPPPAAPPAPLPSPEEVGVPPAPVAPSEPAPPAQPAPEPSGVGVTLESPVTVIPTSGTTTSEPVVPPDNQVAQTMPRLPVGAPATAVSPPIVVPGPGGGSVPKSTPTVPTIPQVESFDEETYACKAGDSFAAISKQKYLTECYAQALLVYNRNHPQASDGVRQEPPLLSAGTPIFIPPVSILEKRYANLIPNLSPIARPTPPPLAQPVSREKPTPLTPSVPPGGGGPGGIAVTTPQYRVTGKNEMMWEIARKTLGQGERWQEIARLNAGSGWKAEFPIPVGAVLRLPPDAKVPAENVPQ